MWWDFKNNFRKSKILFLRRQFTHHIQYEKYDNSEYSRRNWQNKFRIFFVPKSQIPIHYIEIKSDENSVSYTHLDVYKRQVWLFGAKPKKLQTVVIFLQFRILQKKSIQYSKISMTGFCLLYTSRCV